MILVVELPLLLIELMFPANVETEYFPSDSWTPFFIHSILFTRYPNVSQLRVTKESLLTWAEILFTAAVRATV